MNKYELAVVVSAKIEDDERAAVVDKCKALIERFGGAITNVDDWGKKRLAYEVQKMREAFYYLHPVDAESHSAIEIETAFASWTMLSDFSRETGRGIENRYNPHFVRLYPCGQHGRTEVSEERDI